MQQIQIIGTIGKDAEVKTSNSGTQFIVFSVAVNDGYGENKTTVWHDVVQFLNEGKTSKLVDYLAKGVQVYIRGKVKANAYVNKSGETIGTLSVTAFEIKLLSSAEKKSDTPQVESSGHAMTPFLDGNEDGLPF